MLENERDDRETLSLRLVDSTGQDNNVATISDTYESMGSNM